MHHYAGKPLQCEFQTDNLVDLVQGRFTGAVGIQPAGRQFDATQARSDVDNSLFFTGFQVRLYLLRTGRATGRGRR
jgi:hypothetical protein